VVDVVAPEDTPWDETPDGDQDVMRRDWEWGIYRQLDEMDAAEADSTIEFDADLAFELRGDR
jgi:hypothetical protein